jgi:hypothetical protein
MSLHSVFLSIIAILVPLLAVIAHLFQIKKLRLELRKAQENSKAQSPAIIRPTLHEIIEYGGKIRETGGISKREELHAFPFTLFYGWPSTRIVFPVMAGITLDDVTMRKLRTFNHGLKMSSWLLVIALFLLVRHQLQSMWTSLDYLEQFGIFFLMVLFVDFFLARAFELDKRSDTKEQSLNNKNG